MQIMDHRSTETLLSAINHHRTCQSHILYMLEFTFLKETTLKQYFLNAQNLIKKTIFNLDKSSVKKITLLPFHSQKCTVH